MRTFSAKLYGFEQAKERAHAFIRYIQVNNISTLLGFRV